jgi:hypothetical protein
MGSKLALKTTEYKDEVFHCFVHRSPVLLNRVVSVLI